MAQSGGTLAKALDVELRDYLRQFEEAKGTAARIVEGLSDDQLRWSAAPDRWSIAECLGHLNATAEAYFPAVDRAIREGRERGAEGSGPFRHGFLVNRFVKMLEPPPRRRFKTPQLFRPKVDMPAAGTAERFIAHQDALKERVRLAAGLHLARVKLTSPASRFLRMSLGQCFALLATHQRRHLWQARDVRYHSAFPDPRPGRGSDDQSTFSPIR